MRNLASEFGVSVRTIQRDIDVLSMTVPLYTQSGKYCGGVYVVDGYSMDRIYMTDAELCVLRKLHRAADENVQLLTGDEKKLLGFLISQYSKPNKPERLSAADRL